MSALTSSSFQQRGLGMVELMISAVIGLVILAGIFQVYVNSKQSQRMNTAVFRLQENGRVGISLLTTTAQMAGYIADASSSFNSVFPTTVDFVQGAVLSGTDNDNSAGNGIKDSTDWFMVRYQGNADDDLILDCIGNALPNADPGFPNDVFPITFGVSDDNELFCDPGSAGLATRVTIADGVEDMQILFGVDSDNDLAANFFVTAASVTDYSNVIAIRLSLLVRSNDRIATAPMAFTYNGVTTTDPGDRRLRFIFNTTISLRNLAG